MAIQVSLQCSEGRFVLPVDPALPLRDAKRAFREAFEPLGDVNMSAFVLSHKGAFLPDDTVTLESCGVKDGDVLIMVRRRTIPSLNPQDDEQ